jgi:hypothetical protein
LTLPTAFHWDVSPGPYRQAYVLTPNQSWFVGRYVNIYPNGHIRAGTNSKKLI